MQDPEMNKRVLVYVDGFNVYYGFKRKKWNYFLWLDYRQVFESILKQNQELIDVKYFTALSLKGESRQRQETYLNALEIKGGVSIFKGRIVNRPHKCTTCHTKTQRAQEKESDVSIAVEAMLDAMHNRADEVWIVSRDSDLAPLVRTLIDEFGIKVVIIKPPDGSDSGAGGDELVKASGNNPFWIQPRIWKQSQLPDELQSHKGARRQRRPDKWTKPDPA